MTDELSQYADNFQANGGRPPRPKSLISRGSTPIRINEVHPVTGEWRTRIKMSRIKFDDKAQEVFLIEYGHHGRMGDAAAAAGVTSQTVRHYLDTDEEFGEAFLIQEQEYKDRLIEHHQDLVFNGTVKKSYDRNGQLVSEETIYPIRLIELELKKHDSGYRDKQEVKINHTGGVLVAPAEMATIEDWEAKFDKMKVISPPMEGEEPI